MNIFLDREPASVIANTVIRTGRKKKSVVINKYYSKNILGVMYTVILAT